MSGDKHLQVLVYHNREDLIQKPDRTCMTWKIVSLTPKINLFGSIHGIFTLTLIWYDLDRTADPPVLDQLTIPRRETMSLYRMQVILNGIEQKEERKKKEKIKVFFLQASSFKYLCLKKYKKKFIKYRKYVVVLKNTTKYKLDGVGPVDNRPSND